jgi:hypothetical protein
MKKVIKPRGYWTKERCAEEAKKYTRRNEFGKACGSAYTTARDNGWLNEICSHMGSDTKPRGYWTKERCAEEALKYDDKQIFGEKNSACISIIYRNKWDKELLAHIPNKSNKSKRVVYVYEFEDNHVYTGLTYNDKKRTYNHFNDERSPIFQHMKKTGLTPIKKYITEEPVDEVTAQVLEEQTVMEYKLNGWVLLNTAKTGSLGGNKIIWTYEKCKKEALKYSYRSQFKKESPSAHQSAKGMGWLDDLCSHMVYKKKPNGYWTKERCEKSALECNTRMEFHDKFGGAYAKAFHNEWLDEICSHMN